jgi:hypothetical protein
VGRREAASWRDFFHAAFKIEIKDEHFYGTKEGAQRHVNAILDWDLLNLVTHFVKCIDKLEHLFYI